MLVLVAGDESYFDVSSHRYWTRPLDPWTTSAGATVDTSLDLAKGRPRSEVLLIAVDVVGAVQQLNNGSPDCLKKAMMVELLTRSRGLTRLQVIKCSTHYHSHLFDAAARDLGSGDYGSTVEGTRALVQFPSTLPVTAGALKTGHPNHAGDRIPGC